MGCASGIDQLMQLQLNVPLKTPIQTLHDLVTHNVAPVEITLMEQQQLDEGRDYVSTAGNFKQVAR